MDMGKECERSSKRDCTDIKDRGQGCEEKQTRRFARGR